MPLPTPGSHVRDRELNAREWGVDTEVFRARWLRDEAVIPAPWRLERLAVSRVFLAVELWLARPDGARVEVLFEQPGEGRCLAKTRLLQVTCGRHEGVTGYEAALVAEDLARALSVPEGALTEADVRLAFGNQTGASGVNYDALRAVDFRINRACNERCVFCNTPEDAERIAESPAQVHQAIAREFDRGARVAFFTGREPTLDPNLPEYLRRARDQGYVLVNVMTNATTFASGPLLERLLDAGLNGVHASMHTFDPATFEELVGSAHLLEKAIRGIAEVVRHPGVRCQLHCVLTARNLEEFATFPDRVRAHFGDRIAFVNVSPMAPMGDGAARPELLPPYDKLTEVLAKAFARADALGLGMRIPDRCGLPLCATPPAYLARNQELLNPLGTQPEPDKVKFSGCAVCAHNPRCSGVWRGYVDTHGTRGLAPVTADGSVVALGGVPRRLPVLVAGAARRAPRPEELEAAREVDLELARVLVRAPTLPAPLRVGAWALLAVRTTEDAVELVVGDPAPRANLRVGWAPGASAASVTVHAEGDGDGAERVVAALRPMADRIARATTRERWDHALTLVQKRRAIRA